MKHLIIYTHLNPASFSKAIADQVEKISKFSFLGRPFNFCIPNVVGTNASYAKRFY